jgi:hypothetical protein
MNMADAVLMVVVTGTVALALTVDVAAVTTWVKAAMNRWSEPKSG